MTAKANLELQEFVEHLHQCRASLHDSVVVKEGFQGKTVWEGIVSIFDLQGHPIATTCYAWSSPVEGSDRRKFYAVLKTPPINSPQDAVRAAIVTDHKQGG